MRTTTRIPIWRTLVNWISVVVLGSIFAPLLLSAYEVERFEPEIIGAFIVISGACSLPAVIIFILVNWGMNKEKMPTGRYRIWQGVIHLGVSILTFLVLAMMNGGLGMLSFDKFLLIVAVTYTTLGQIAWWLTFLSHQEGPAEKPENRELLDDLPS